VARRDRRSRGRLDQPRLPGPSLRPSVDVENFGNVVERVARFLGTGRYLVYQSIFIIAWLLFNIFAPKAVRFDPYTFTFLTLLLSLQASYAAPLILLAQNRQDDRDRVNLSQDRDQNSRLLADAEYLTREVASLRVSLGEVVTRDYLRAELRSFLDELDEDADERPDRGRGDKRTDKQRADKQRPDKQRTEKQRGDKQRGDRLRTDRPRTEKARADRAQNEKTRAENSQSDRRRVERRAVNPSLPAEPWTRHAEPPTQQPGPPSPNESGPPTSGSESPAPEHPTE
jgi:uncharacterized membrane protein